MAGLSNADPRHRFTVDAPPPTIAKDMQGSDSSVPLSPQWLLPKLGDNKLGLASGEPHPYVSKHTEPVKVLGNVEEHNAAEKKKDVFRPSFYDTEHGRRDRWREEERAANSAVRRDRRREGAELVASRKAERWSDSSSRYSVEVCHFPSERWTDSGNKESAYEQRRDSKWNSRWGPDDKESENWREKFSGKDGESTRDKGTPHIAIHGKDIKHQSRDTDKEGEHHTHSWRSSPSINRSRVESIPYLPSSTNKPAPMFGCGRGKGENGPIIKIGRSRACSSMSTAADGPSRHFHLGNSSDRSNDSHGDPLIIRYSRMKLFDIYRTTDLKGYKMPSEGFQEVPFLIRAEPLEPLALTAPIAEELVILKAIDKGEIVSSGVPQASKDDSTGKNTVDSGLLPAKGIGEDVAHVVSDHRDESIDDEKKDNSCYSESASFEKCSYLFDSELSRRQNLHQYHEEKLTAEALEFEAAPNKACESSNRKVSKIDSTIPWRSQLVRGGSLQSSNDLGGLDEDRSGSTDMGLLNTQKHGGIEQRNSYAASSSYLRGNLQWQDTLNLPLEVRNKSQIRRQTSEIIEQERESLLNVHDQDDPFIFRDLLTDRIPQPYLLPKDLHLFYKDPHGQIQGPFSGSNLIEWFDAGYFGIDLQVRLAGTPSDAPFSLLGDVIPQLRTRVRPPPGFGTGRLNDAVDVANRGKFVGSSSVHAGNESKVEAENRFLESLMSRRTSSSLSESYLLPEGMQGYNGLAGGRSLSGTEDMGDMKKLPRKMSLEQQSAVLTPYWPGREPPAILSKADPIPDPSFHPPKFLPQIGEGPHHVPWSPQKLDLQSILQSAAEKAHSQPIPSSLPLWPTFPEAQALKNAHGSMDILKDTSELHHSLQNSHVVFGTPPNLETQSQPSLPNLNPLGNLSSGVMPPEKLVAPEFSEDLQMINLLQQQYMRTQQVHSQVPPLTHLNMEFLLLMQRQKQEQQLNQMLMQQQQQQQQQFFLSHALSGHLSHQYFDEPSFEHLNAGVVNENASLNNPILQQLHEMVQRKQQMHVLDSSDSIVSNLSNLNLHDVQDASITVGTGHLPLNLPNQFIDLTSHPNAMDSTPLLDVGHTQNSDAKQIASTGDSLVSAENGSAQDAFLSQTNTRDMDTSVASQGLSQTNEMVTIVSDAVNSLVSSKKGTRNNIDLTPAAVSKKIDDVKISSNTISGQAHAETPGLEVVEVTEQRELKKVPEKKSRKQKTSQLRAASEHGKGSLKAAPSLHSRTNLETGATKKAIHMEVLEPLYRTPEARSEISAPSAMESLDSIDKKTELNEGRVEESEFGLSISNLKVSPNNRTWKPAPGQKTKSLLEIQLEEQCRVHTQSLASDILPEIMTTNASAIPLAGSSINQEQKYAPDAAQSVSLTRPISENPENPWNSKNWRSQSYDVLAEEVLAKPGGKDTKGCEEQRESLPPLPQAGGHIGEFVTADDDFVEAKETRKGRKKAMKNKGAAGKASVPVTSADLSVSASTIDKTKAIRQTEQDKELLPGPPAAPSFGDFVLWRTDEGSSVQAPAWSSDSSKLQKPASLRDILKEQDKKTKSVRQQIPIPTLAKVQPSRGSGGSSSSRQVSGSSPSKVALSLNSKSASPVQTGSESLGQPKMATQQDLFWGPLDQAKQGSSSDSSKGVQGTPVKESYGEGSNRKASSRKAAEHSITSSQAIGQSLSKGKKDSESKYTEATDFRDWCEGEWLRLTGTNDTSFPEFCLKQTTAEAEALLRENLGSLDRSHEFIDKFISYKEFLSGEVIEIAFRGQRRSKEEHAQASHGTRVSRDGVDGSSKGKKGKKGKKLSPAMLGFSVVSNRIMMGEIQTIDD